MWQSVQAWYFVVWLWNDGTPGTEESTVSVWQLKHNRFIWV